MVLFLLGGFRGGGGVCRICRDGYGCFTKTSVASPFQAVCRYVASLDTKKKDSLKEILKAKSGHSPAKRSKWATDRDAIIAGLKQGPRERRDTPTGPEYDDWSERDQTAFHLTRAFINDVYDVDEDAECAADEEFSGDAFSGDAFSDEAFSGDTVSDAVSDAVSDVQRWGPHVPRS